MKEPERPVWPDETAERYRRDGYWTNDTFGAVLRAGAETHPDRVAVVSRRRVLTYGALDRRADRLGAALAGLGLRPGDRVLVQLPNEAELVEVLFALFRLGAVPVLVLPPLRRGEIGRLGRISGATGYVLAAVDGPDDPLALAREVRDAVPTLRHIVVAGAGGEAGAHIPLGELDEDPADLPRPGAGDLALLHMAGGRTAEPKLIPRTHADYLCTTRLCRARVGFGESGVYLAALPAVHNFPLASPGVLGALDAGGRAVLASLPTPDVVFPLIEAERVTHTALVPPLARIWIGNASAGTRHDLSSLRVLQVGGAKCGPELARRVKPVLGCTLVQSFGMAEGIIHLTGLDDADEVIEETQGRPLCAADEVRVVGPDGRDVPDGEPGELLARGPYTIRGYYRAGAYNASAFTPDGYYRTGDLVRRRADGNVVVVGRVKDQINRGGEKVAAPEIEAQLLAHPQVRETAVVAQPDAYLGERIRAFVVPDGEPPGTRDLLAFFRTRGLAAYKTPDRIEFVSELPRTSTGEIDKNELRADAMAQEGKRDTVKL